MPRAFLTARWSHVCILSFPVPAELLQPRVPKGIELDTSRGQAFVSFVAFQFQKTRVLGLPWPWDFAEINLRYYIHRQGERGVVFIREFVPHRLVAWSARTIYNEPYLAAPIASRIDETAERITAEYVLTYQSRSYTLSVTGKKPAETRPESSVEHFFKEHHWGYNTGRKGQTQVYRVEHPVWDIYRVESHRLELDWGQLYGPEWQFLNGRQAESVVMAVGSEVAVLPAGTLD